MADHALLSPSGASRWLACPPSARLEAEFPDRSGAAAEEGTVAHALGELLLRQFFELIQPEEFQTELLDIKASKYFGNEMQMYSENYRDFVIERFNDAQMQTRDAMIFLEQKLDITEYVPEGFGTGDCVIIADGTLDIIDLKYGKGVLVSAVENKQMMLYGLAALRQFEIMFSIDTVRMTIYQPRLDNYSTYELPASELTRWAENELRPRAKLAWEGEGQQVVGSHCGFCKAKARCRAQAEYNLALARNEFKTTEMLTNDEVSEVLTRVDSLVGWANAIKDFALIEAIKGTKWPGFKVVEGRSTRKYIDEDAVAETVLDLGFPETDVYTKKLIGIGAMEKLIGKKNVTEILADHIAKPSGAPTLVPVTDKRPEFNSAVADFAAIEQED